MKIGRIIYYWTNILLVLLLLCWVPLWILLMDASQVIESITTQSYNQLYFETNIPKIGCKIFYACNLILLIDRMIAVNLEPIRAWQRQIS